MVRRILKIASIFILALMGVLLVSVLILMASGSGSFRITLPVKHNDIYTLPQGSSYPVALHAEGNQLVTAAGEPVRLRGVMIPDPYRLEGENRFNQDLITEIQNTGANVIRVPVHPENWQKDEDYLWRYLDPLVTWAGDAGLYVIIDLHFIGNISTGAGQLMPDLELSAAEFADQFWSQVASYFRNAPHVLFEIYNEPADISTADWVKSSTHLVELIRSKEVTQTLIIGGVEYSKNLFWVLENPLNDDNLAYAAHIYPSHPRRDWPYWFGKVADQYPILITEWGYLDAKTVEGPAYLAGTRQGYGEPLLTYLDELGAGWVACWYDDKWLPSMFAPGRETLNEYGQWVIGELNP